MSDWSRLGDFVRKQREDLGLTQADVQERGGPSTALLRTIENKRATTLSRSKKAGLESALRWESGSVDSILAGGVPKFADGGRDATEETASAVLHTANEVSLAAIVELMGAAQAANEAIARASSALDSGRRPADALETLIAESRRLERASAIVVEDWFGGREKMADYVAYLNSLLRQPPRRAESAPSSMPVRPRVNQWRPEYEEGEAAPSAETHPR